MTPNRAVGSPIRQPASRLAQRLSHFRPARQASHGEARGDQRAEQRREPLPHWLVQDLVERPGRQIPHPRGQAIGHAKSGRRPPGRDHTALASLRRQVLHQFIELSGPGEAVRREEELARAFAVLDLGDRDLGSGYGPTRKVLRLGRRGIGYLLERGQVDAVHRIVEVERVADPDFFQQGLANSAQVQCSERPSHLDFRRLAALAQPPASISRLRVLAEGQESAARARCIDGLQRVGIGLRGHARSGNAQPEQRRRQQPARCDGNAPVEATVGHDPHPRRSCWLTARRAEGYSRTCLRSRPVGMDTSRRQRKV